jgi:signal transduction histidine kinase/DNA-binding response OmpR family regulator
MTFPRHKFGSKATMQLGISHRIALSFAWLLITSFIITAINLSGLRELYQSFSTFQVVSQHATLSAKLDLDASELQRQILAFSNTEKNIPDTELKHWHKQLLKDTKELVAIENQEHGLQKNTPDTLIAQKMQTITEHFGEHIENLKTRRTHRNDLVDIQLKNILADNESVLSQLFTLVKTSKNSQLLDSIWQLQLLTSKNEEQMARYFSRHEYQRKQDVITEISTIKEVIATIRTNTSTDITYADDINAIVEYLSLNADKRKELFIKAAQADRNYLTLVNVVIAGESAELRQLARTMALTQAEQQEALFISTEKSVQRNQKLYIGISVIGAIFAIVIALITGRSIAKSLQSITKTFDLLAQGTEVDRIPGASRQDEIGRLAQAANVFRETNAKTKMLLLQTRQFAATLEAREADLEQAVQKAQDASQAKSQFLANMSHELRTPMNAILGMLSLLRKTHLDSAQLNYTTKTESAARSLLYLLNGILDLSKAEAGKMELDPAPFSLDALLQDLADILTSSNTNPSIAINIHAADNVPRFLLGDALLLKQTLINLGANAIKFTEQGSVSLIITQHARDEKETYLTFSIQDTGIGIAEKNIDAIFSEFTQAEASTTRRFGGTGLGLSICQKIVALMGGKISVTSKEGVGSHFSFSIVLPILQDDCITRVSHEKANEAAPTDKLSLRGMRILLVEDNINNQEIASELLTWEGAIVQIANHGQEALNILSDNIKQQGNPGVDAVLMDLQMPVLDGLSASIEIRKTLQLEHLPIIAMTANAMLSDRKACLAAGMNDHIGKPFELKHLVNTLLKHAAKACLSLPPDSYNTPETNDENPVQDIIKFDAIEFDVAAAIARLGGRQDLFLRMLPKFSDNLRSIQSQLQTAIAQNTFHDTALTLHSLKGAAGAMGATQLAAYATQAETLLKASSLDDARVMINAICTHIEHSIPQLSEIELFLKNTINAQKTVTEAPNSRQHGAH